MTQKTDEIIIDEAQTLDVILLQVLNHALVSIGAEAGSLMLVDHKQGILQVKARLGKPQITRKTEPVFEISSQGEPQSIASWVVQNKQSYVCSDVKSDPFFANPSSDSYSSLLSVPILCKDKVLAVINADSEEKNYFIDERRKIMESVAQQVAIPIDERISLIDALSKMGMELTSLTKNGGVELVLQKIANLAIQSLGADVIMLYQYNQKDDKFLMGDAGPTIVGDLKTPHLIDRELHRESAPWRIIKEHKSGFYSNIHGYDFLFDEFQRPDDIPRPRFVERERIESMAVLPLTFRATELGNQEVVGVIFVNYRTRHDFNIDESSALNSFADYAAVAIINARREEQRYEEQRHQAEQERKMEQMRIVETVSANFAHRMSNLAGTGRIATQYLREHIDPSDKFAYRQLDRIEREANTLLALAERLTYPFKETGSNIEPRPIDITQVLQEELVRIEPDLKGIKVIKDLARKLPKVRSVEFQLRQVLNDIINNALEAMQDQEDAQLTIRAKLNWDKNQVEIEILDSGPGIHDDIRDRLFAPGVTTKKDKLGIGLWWCRTFMQATGGDVVWKDTSPEEGTVFVVEIPCVKEEVISFAKKPSRSPGKELDILIVEDREEWHDPLRDALHPEVYDIETAASYTEALHALTTNYFRLIVVDIKLDVADPKNRDGMRLLSELNKAGLDTKVIIVTGHGTEELEQRARQSPSLLGFINKDQFDIGKFRDLIRKAIGNDVSS